MTYDRQWMAIEIRQAQPSDARIVADILVEASAWVDSLGVVMWEEDELDPEHIVAEVAAGQFFIAYLTGEPAGVIRFQLEDRLFWPDLPQDASAFVHRLAVRRRFKGQGVSQALLAWSVERTRVLGRRHLRLDCDESRPKLRALYEGFGFRFHSFRHVGAYYVARYEYPLSE
ncbi:MAG TPA: GNAT family N-acetyltransferase [Vicinamibacterales bacterium]